MFLHLENYSGPKEPGHDIIALQVIEYIVPLDKTLPQISFDTPPAI